MLYLFSSFIKKKERTYVKVVVCCYIISIGIVRLNKSEEYVRLLMIVLFPDVAFAVVELRQCNIDR